MNVLCREFLLTHQRQFLLTHQVPVIVVDRGSGDCTTAKTRSEQGVERKHAMVERGSRGSIGGGQGRSVGPREGRRAQSCIFPRTSEGRMRGEGRVLGSRSPGDEQSGLWRRACPPPCYLGQGEYPPQCAPASRKWICHSPV